MQLLSSFFEVQLKWVMKVILNRIVYKRGQIHTAMYIRMLQRL